MMSRSGSCTACGVEQLVERGRVVEHTTKIEQIVSLSSGYPKVGASPTTRVIEQRCRGSLRSPVEDLAKQRARSADKRRALVSAVRDDASVLLDAILTKRTDLDEEFPKERREELLKLALVKYRLDWPKARKITNGLFWWTGTVQRGVRGHKLFCRFCGFLVARFPIGAWAKLRQDERDLACGAHVFQCALTYLAGLRAAPEPKTMLDGYDGPMFDEALGRRCPACGAAAGVTCVEIGLLEGEDYPARSTASIHREPHDARRCA